MSYQLLDTDTWQMKWEKAQLMTCYAYSYTAACFNNKPRCISQLSMALTVDISTITKLFWHVSTSVPLYNLLNLVCSVNRLRTVQLKRSVCALWPHADHCSPLRKLQAASLSLIHKEWLLCRRPLKDMRLEIALHYLLIYYEWNKGRSLCAVAAKIDAL